MSDVYWARVEPRKGGRKALVLFRREIQRVSRGQALVEVPVLVLEGAGPSAEQWKAATFAVNWEPQGVDGEAVAKVTITPSSTVPKDPEIRRTNFDDAPDPKKKRARGMGKTATDGRKAAPGNPPVPVEQRGTRSAPGKRKRRPGGRGNAQRRKR